MIHAIPDRVLTWIGGQGALTGEEKEMAGRGHAQITAVGGAMNSIMLGKNMQGSAKQNPKEPPKPKKIG